MGRAHRHFSAPSGAETRHLPSPHGCLLWVRSVLQSWERVHRAAGLQGKGLGTDSGSQGTTGRLHHLLFPPRGTEINPVPRVQESCVAPAPGAWRDHLGTEGSTHPQASTQSSVSTFLEKWGYPPSACRTGLGVKHTPAFFPGPTWRQETHVEPRKVFLACATSLGLRLPVCTMASYSNPAGLEKLRKPVPVGLNKQQQRPCPGPKGTPPHPRPCGLGVPLWPASPALS